MWDYYYYVLLLLLLLIIRMESDTNLVQNEPALYINGETHQSPTNPSLANH